MELDISIDNDSLSITISNPFQLDTDSIIEEIEGFLSSQGTGMDGIDMHGLIPLMVKSIAGCERGCPSRAKSLVSDGYKNFELSYIEGGILSAKTVTDNKKVLHLKMFPHF